MREAFSRELATVQRRVEHWRKGHGGRGSRIPEELWQAAVGAAEVSGVYATSRALRFNYERLKTRLVQAESGSSACGTPVESAGPADGTHGSGFVALEMGSVLTGKTVIELVGRGGERMRIDITGSAVDLVGLAQTFWSQQS